MRSAIHTPRCAVRARAQKRVHRDICTGECGLHCCDAINRLRDVCGQAVEIDFGIAFDLACRGRQEHLNDCAALGRVSRNDKPVAPVVALAAQHHEMAILKPAQQVFYDLGRALPGGFHEIDARRAAINCPTVDRSHLGVGEKCDHTIWSARSMGVFGTSNDVKIRERHGQSKPFLAKEPQKRCVRFVLFSVPLPINRRDKPPCLSSPQSQSPTHSVDELLRDCTPFRRFALNCHKPLDIDGVLVYTFGRYGGVRERLNRAVLKTVDLRGSVGSNPTPTANKLLL